VLIQHAKFFLITRIRVESTGVWVNANKNKNLSTILVPVDLNFMCIMMCYDHNHFRECHNHTHTCQNHTLRVEITLVRDEITIVCMSKLHSSACRNQTLRVEITLCVQKIYSCVYPIHHACETSYIIHLIMRVNITLCV
jgi:hypothetical protein